MSKAAVGTVEATEETNEGVQLAPLAGACVGEFIGTFVLMLVGDGAVAAAVFTGATPSPKHIDSILDFRF